MVKVKDLVEKYGDREIDEVELEKILKPKKKTIYNLELGDTFYSICITGSIDMHIWRDRDFDRAVLSLGNVYLTREDAEFALVHRTHGRATRFS